MPRADIQLTVKLIDEATRPIREMTRVIDEQLRLIRRQSENTNRSLRQISDTANRMRSSVAQVAYAMRSLYAIATAYIGLNIAQSIAHLSDQYQLLTARLKLVTSSQEEFNRVQSKLFRIAQKTRASYSTTIETYTRLARALKIRGVESEKILRVLESLNNAILASGLSTQEASAGLLQLSQALASGRLQGDEFRSVMENLPPVSQAIADYLGVTIGQLYKLREEGKITSDVVINALLASFEKFQQQAQSLPVTVGQAWQMMQNSWLRLVGTYSESTHAFDAVKAALMAISMTMDQMQTGKLAKDFKILGTIGIEVFKGLTYGAQYFLKALLGLKSIVRIIQILILKYEDIFWGVTERIFRGVYSILNRINNLPGIGRLIPDAALKKLQEGITIVHDFRDALKDAFKDYEKDLWHTADQIEATDRIFSQLRANFDEAMKRLSQSGNEAGQQLNNVAQQGEKVVETTNKFTNATKEHEKKQRELEATQRRILELQKKLYLDTLPEGQRALEEINVEWEKYRQQIEEAYKKGCIAAEKYSKMLSLLDRWKEVQIKQIKEQELQRKYQKEEEEFQEKAQKFQKIIELQKKLYLDILPKGERELAELNRQWEEYAKQIEEAYKSGLITEEKYNELMQLLEKWKEKQKEQLQESVKDHEKVTDEIQNIWQHTYERLTDIVADWIYNLKFSFDSILDFFRRAVAQMVATWIMGQARMVFGGIFAPAGVVAGAGGTGAGAGAGGAGGNALSLLGLINMFKDGFIKGLENFFTSPLRATEFLLKKFPNSGFLASVHDFFASSIGTVAGAGIMSGIATYLFTQDWKRTIGAGLGSAGGWAIGSLFGSAGGPIGALIGGALGSIVGGLFGGNKKRSYLGRAYGLEYIPGEGWQLTGNIEFREKRKGEKFREIADQLAEALVGNLNQITQEMSQLLNVFGETYQKKFENLLEQITGEYYYYHGDKPWQQYREQLDSQAVFEIQISAEDEGEVREDVAANIQHFYKWFVSKVIEAGKQVFTEASQEFDGVMLYFQDEVAQKYQDRIQQIFDILSSMPQKWDETSIQQWHQKVMMALQELDAMYQNIQGVSQVIQQLNEGLFLATDLGKELAGVTQNVESFKMTLEALGVDLSKVNTQLTNYQETLFRLTLAQKYPELYDVNQLILEDTLQRIQPALSYLFGTTASKIREMVENGIYQPFIDYLWDIGSHIDELTQIAQETGIPLDKLIALIGNLGDIAYQTFKKIEQEREVIRRQLEQEVEAAERNYQDLLEEARRLEKRQREEAHQAYIRSLQEELNEKQRLAQETERTIEVFENLIKSIREYRSELLSSVMEPSMAYMYAKRQFFSIVEQLRSKNIETVQSAMEKLPSVGRTFLEASQRFSSYEDYQRDVYTVLSVLNKAEKIGLNIQDKQTKYLKSIQQEIETLDQTIENASKSATGSIITSLNAIYAQIKEAKQAYLEALERLNAFNAGIAVDVKDLRQKFIDILNRIKNHNEPIRYIDDPNTDTGSSFANLMKRWEEINKKVDRMIDYIRIGDIKGFAEGGTVIKPTLALIGESGTEHVIPDTKLKKISEQLKEVKEILWMLLNTNGDMNKALKKHLNIITGWEIEGLPSVRQ